MGNLGTHGESDDRIAPDPIRKEKLVMIMEINKERLLKYLEKEISRLSRLELYKGGLDAGYAIAVITLKSKIEEGIFDIAGINTTGRAWDP